MAMWKVTVAPSENPEIWPICAERGALAAAVAAGARGFSRLVVYTDTDKPVAPCGLCRQALAEFGLDLEVAAIAGRSRTQWTLAELLPVAFGQSDLSRRGESSVSEEGNIA